MELVELVKNTLCTVILVDFDKTITTKKSETSIGVFQKVLPYEYCKKKKKIDYVLKKHINDRKMQKYWYYKFKLLRKYNAVKELNLILSYFEIREEFKTLYYYCKINNIKIIIVSAGYKDLINNVLIKNNLLGIEVYANELNTKTKKIITPRNKNNVKFSLENEKVVIIGDSVYDLKINDGYCVLSIGFCLTKEEERLYDREFDYVIKDYD